MSDIENGGENSLEALAKRLAETVAQNDQTSEQSSDAPSAIENANAATLQQVALELGDYAFAESEAEVQDHAEHAANSVESLDEANEDSESSEPTEFIEIDRLDSILESLLFSTDKPVSVAVMRQIFKGSNIRSKHITAALDRIASSYAAGNRGVALEEIHGGYQLRTKVDNTEYLKRLARVRPFRLSGPALEVLAIMAYKQPITKAEVDQIRGVESGHLVRALMERGLATFGEKSDLPGRPMTYTTTRKFLETFGLRNLKELPTLTEIDELLPEGIGDEEEKESLSDLTAAMSNEIKGSYSEGEEELQNIADTLKVIDTTSEFFEQEKIRQRVERDRERAQDIRERITVGEMVDEKDRRWLSRFEAKQEQIARAAEAGDAAGPLVVEDEAGEAGAAGLAATAGDAAGEPEASHSASDNTFSEKLSELSAESMNRSDSSDDEEGFSASESDDEDLGDLESNLDYDDGDDDEAEASFGRDSAKDDREPEQQA